MNANGSGVTPHHKIAVVIPCYQTRDKVLSVVKGIGQEVAQIYVVDDHCPQNTGDYVKQNCTDPRVVMLKNDTNRGVGGATITGYRRAMADGASIVVKLDSDGQMDPALIPVLVKPICNGVTDFTKGNRFYLPEYLRGMPLIRRFGNAVLSVMAKFSTGYWNITDPTNGFTAMHAKVLQLLPLDKLDERYFFETDVLFRLSLVRAVALDIPMQSRYGDETSGIRLGRASLEFAVKHFVRVIKRIFYLYFLREFNPGTLQLTGGTVLLGGGLVFGISQWITSSQMHTPATSGTVMLAALPVLLGFNLLLSALSYDVFNIPKQVLHRLL